MNPASTVPRVIVHGARGRMGQALLRLAGERSDLQLVAAVSRSAPPQRVVDGIAHFASSELDGLPAFDVAIDFSLPDGPTGVSVIPSDGSTEWHAESAMNFDITGKRVRGAGYFAGSLRGAGGERRLAIEEHRMDDAAHVPQLHDDQAAFLVHRLGGGLPRFGLLVAPDARRARPAQTFAADAGRFGQDHACAGTLAVIGRHQFVGHEHRFSRAATGQRSHVDAVLGMERAHLERLEQSVVHMWVILIGQFRLAIHLGARRLGRKHGK